MSQVLVSCELILLQVLLHVHFSLQFSDESCPTIYVLARMLERTLCVLCLQNGQ
jgi:hypothetical protein